MRTIVTNARGLSVLASVLVDPLAAMLAVGSALALGGWLCMAAMSPY